MLMKAATQWVYFLDSPTENFMASGYRDPRTGIKAHSNLDDMDGKCVLIKELSTMFSLRHDKVRKLLGDFQSIFDREYNKPTGTVGRVTVKAAFSIVASITPLALTKHRGYMDEIGSRFLMYKIPSLTEAERAVGLNLLREPQRKKKLTELRDLVAAHINDLLTFPVELEVETEEQWEVIKRLAALVACGRTTIRYENFGGYYEIGDIQQEEPFRIAQQLRTLTRALARVHGRLRITDHELELVRRVALGSLPLDRFQILALLPDFIDGLTVKDCAGRIQKGEDRTSTLLGQLVLLGLLERKPGEGSSGDGGGRPSDIYQPKPWLTDLLTRPFEDLDHGADLSSVIEGKR
jgi:hypothetical protein